MKEYLKIYGYHIVMGYGMLALLIYGIDVSDDRLVNIPIFWFWTISILGLFAISESFVDDMVKSRKDGEKQLHMAFMYAFIFVSIPVFIYNGFIYLAAISTVLSIFRVAAQQKINEKLEKK